MLEAAYVQIYDTKLLNHKIGVALDLLDSQRSQLSEERVHLVTDHLKPCREDLIELSCCIPVKDDWIAVVQLLERRQLLISPKDGHLLAELPQLWERCHIFKLLYLRASRQFLVGELALNIIDLLANSS